MKELMDEHDIDIRMHENENGEDHNIEIHMDEEGHEKEVEVTIQGDNKNAGSSKIKIMKSQDGEVEDFEFEIEGDEISDDIKKMLEEEGIDLQVLEGGSDGSKKIIVVTEEDSDNVVPHKAQLGVYLDMDGDEVKIDGVVKESAAEKAGLQKGDIITTVNDVIIRSNEQLINELKKYAVSDVIKIDYIRNNKNNSVELKLEERKDLDSQMEMKTWEEVIEHGQNKAGKKVHIEKKVIIKKNK